VFVDYTADGLKKHLGLKPLVAGGYYVEVYRSTDTVTTERGQLVSGTNIYFLLDRESPRELFHRMLSDEVWHFYMGDPLTILELDASGQVVETVLGNDLLGGQTFTHVVTRNRWFAAELMKDGACGWSLIGATVCPGFEWSDLTIGNRDELLGLFPEARDTIIKYTDAKH
jgi:predicted cupin superfamily sugar epimerase